MKEVLVSIFKIIGLIVISGLLWELTVGWFVESTQPTNVYPSAFNKTLYETSTRVYASRMYNDLGQGGTFYNASTQNAWGSADGTVYSTQKE